MKPVCESMAQNIFPGIRASMALELQKSYGLSQSEIADKLGVSQPAISQYVRQLRGAKTKIFDNKIIKDSINVLCQKISSGMERDQLVIEFCNICKLIRSEGMVKGEYLTVNCKA